MTRWIGPVGLAFAMMAAGRLANAQGCAMCYNDAAAASAQAIHALRSGILVLATPPIAIFAIIFGVAYRNRNRYHRAGGEPIARKVQQETIAAAGRIR